MMTLLIIGGIGIVLLLVSLVFGELFELGDADFGGFATDVLSTAGLAGLFGGVGFIGALMLSITHSMVLSIAVGSVAGIGLAYGAGWLTKILKNDESGSTITIKNLVGIEGSVVSEIPSSGYGQIRVQHRGELLTLNAAADSRMSVGETVWITSVLSPTAVTVQAVHPLDAPSR